VPFEVAASQKDQTLPMVLNLRGDEAIAEAFSYDSEQAMSFLGIKRSRLNQISGRELRVARVRRDRYVRPVYRESDLKDYLEWTRATATHLSSSKAIEQAVENLDDRFNDVLQVFNQKLDQVADEQRDFIRSEFKSRASEPVPAVQGDEEPERSLVHVGKVLLKHSARLAELRSELMRACDRLDPIQGSLDCFLAELKEMSVGQRGLRLDLEQRFGELSAGLKACRDAIVELQQSQEENAARLQSAISEEKDREPQVSARVAEPRRRRTLIRRSYFR
jgi:hypothetical protein